jgi:protein-S-isoprenylcysteine O-methyltransferase Ste14
MTQSNKRKQAKNTAHRSSNPQKSTSGSHVMRVFMMYFVVFGTILAFVGLMGDDGLPGSGWFVWLLLVLNFVISIVATISHTRSGQRSNIDEIAEKW